MNSHYFGMTLENLCQPLLVVDTDGGYDSMFGLVVMALAGLVPQVKIRISVKLQTCSKFSLLLNVLHRLTKDLTVKNLCSFCRSGPVGLVAGRHPYFC